MTIKDEPCLRVIRLTETSEDTHKILPEYYEAVHVEQRDEPGALQNMIDNAASCCALCSDLSPYTKNENFLISRETASSGQWRRRQPIPPRSPAVQPGHESRRRVSH